MLRKRILLNNMRFSDCSLIYLDTKNVRLPKIEITDMKNTDVTLIDLINKVKIIAIKIKLFITNNKYDLRYEPNTISDSDTNKRSMSLKLYLND